MELRAPQKSGVFFHQLCAYQLLKDVAFGLGLLETLFNSYAHDMKYILIRTYICCHKHVYISSMFNQTLPRSKMVTNHQVHRAEFPLKVYSYSTRQRYSLLLYNTNVYRTLPCSHDLATGLYVFVYLWFI
jgi:hypothetical protein